MNQPTARERRDYVRQNPTGRYIVKCCGQKGILIRDGKRIAQFDSAWEALQIADTLNTRASVTADPRVAELEAALEEAHRAGVSVVMGAGPHSEGRMSIMETWRVRDLGVAMQRLHTLLATSNVQPATPQPSGEVA